MNDWLVVVPQVSGEEYASTLFIISCALDFDQDEARPKNMTGDAKSGANSRGNFERFAGVIDRLDQLDRCSSVILRVEGKSGLMFRQGVSITIVSVFFLKTSRIREQYLEEIRRTPGAVDG